MNIYFFDKSHLPKRGWFQSCLMCSSITGSCYLEQVIKKDDKKYNINCYLCDVCYKEMCDNEKFYRKYDDVYLKNLRKWSIYNDIDLN